MLLNPLLNHPDYETTLRNLPGDSVWTNMMRIGKLSAGEIALQLSTVRERYLTLLKKALTFSIYDYTDCEIPIGVHKTKPQEYGHRQEGRDWPSIGESMIGLKRMDNIQKCLTDVLECSIEGDVIEAGVWRGGASIFMRAILDSYNSQKKVYVADSFKGLPAPDLSRYPQDRGLDLSNHPTLTCSLKEVKRNFERYGYLDEQVVFVEGWFKDSLPALNMNKWSVIRLDGDMYESTMQSLEHLYPSLQRGGYLIQDDYNCIRQAREATDDFREKHGITEPIQKIDWAGIFWRKEN